MKLENLFGMYIHRIPGLESVLPFWYYYQSLPMPSFETSKYFDDSTMLEMNVYLKTDLCKKNIVYLGMTSDFLPGKNAVLLGKL